MQHVFYCPVYGTVPRAYNGTLRVCFLQISWELWVGVNQSVVVKLLNQVSQLWVNKEAWYSFFTFSTSLILIVLCSNENFSPFRYSISSKQLRVRAEPANEAESTSFEHLKWFVKSLKGKLLSMFLWFCTGNDVITVQNIDVHFTTLERLQRCPIAIKYVSLLDLPSTYESYSTLVEEFTNVRKEQAWFFNTLVRKMWKFKMNTLDALKSTLWTLWSELWTLWNEQF